MTAVSIQKELRDLKQRQERLERAFQAALGVRPIEYGEEIQPQYLKKLRRIMRDVRSGKGVTVVRTRKELKRFFRDR